MNPHDLVNIVIGVAVFVLIVFRQFVARRVTIAQTAVIPILLVAYGLFAGVVSPKSGPLLDHAHPAVSVALLVLGLLVGVATGVWRAMTMRVWRDPAGDLWRKGNAHTALAWFGSIVARVGLAVGAGYLLHVTESTGAILIAAGLSLLVQNLVVARRADGMQRGAPASVAA